MPRVAIIYTRELKGIDDTPLQSRNPTPEDTDRDPEELPGEVAEYIASHDELCSSYEAAIVRQKKLITSYREQNMSNIQAKDKLHKKVNRSKTSIASTRVLPKSLSTSAIRQCQKLETTIGRRDTTIEASAATIKKLGHTIDVSRQVHAGLLQDIDNKDAKALELEAKVKAQKAVILENKLVIAKLRSNERVSVDKTWKKLAKVVGDPTDQETQLRHADDVILAEDRLKIVKGELRAAQKDLATANRFIEEKEKGKEIKNIRTGAVPPPGRATPRPRTGSAPRQDHVNLRDRKDVCPLEFRLDNPVTCKNEKCKGRRIHRRGLNQILANSLSG
ncbi:hypothetical protein CC86DRAFT_410722 [Ophiobolus disseminans]|uniref:Uncharacterized protein n=1 Tax=Ophiobolus disseminans TaxID=1469910 RepID=A0A6A6ZMP3_9PLEO|nr:hypothetical protein CC86DRAFT_410722 [Ophiobolus disseminans]